MTETECRGELPLKNESTKPGNLEKGHTLSEFDSGFAQTEKRLTNGSKRTSIGSSLARCLPFWVTPMHVSGLGNFLGLGYLHRIMLFGTVMGHTYCTQTNSCLSGYFRILDDKVRFVPHPLQTKTEWHWVPPSGLSTFHSVNKQLIASCRQEVMVLELEGGWCC